MPTRRRFLGGSIVALCASAGMLPIAHGQVAGKTVRILIGFPPGGTADVIGRALAERLRGSYATSVIVENKPGAKFVPVMGDLMSSAPDGSTFYVGPDAVSTLLPYLYRKLPYDALRDLVPVSTVALHELAFAVGPNVPVSSLAEFLQWVKGDSKNSFYGTLGMGSQPHFFGVMLARAAGVDLTPVPYAGAAPSVQALLGGQVPSWVGPLPDIAPHHRGGKVRVIATSGAQRSRFLPDVRTFTDAGYPSLVEYSRFGVYLRSGTPPSLVAALNKAVLGALEHPGFRAVLDKISFEPLGGSPQEFADFIRREHESWRGIVKTSGISLEE